jgi:hypothetical protein
MYGNVLQCVRHVHLYFRNVSGNLESSETARRHTAGESDVCCLSLKVTSKRNVNIVE